MAHRASSSRRIVSGLGVLWLAISVGTEQSAAADFTLDAGYQARLTDNVGLVPENERSDVVHTPFLRLGGNHEGSWLRTTANYEYRRRIFQDGSFRNDHVVNGSGSLVAELAPSRLFWDLTHTRTQALADVRNVNNPLNQQEINTIGSGFEYRTSEERRNQIRTSLRYDDQRSSVEVNDSGRTSASLNLIRRLSPRLRTGVRVQGLDVDFREDFAPDFQRLDLRLVAGREGPRLRFEVTGGLNWVDRKGLDVRDGFAASANAEFAITQSQRVTLLAEDRLGDQTNFAVAGIPAPGSAPEQGVFGNVFELRTVQVQYALDRPRSRFQLTLAANDQDFDEGRTDLSSEQISLSWSRELTPSLRLSVLATFRQQEFGAVTEDRPPREDELLLSQVNFQWRLGARTRFSLGVRYDESESTADIVNFTERSVLLSFERTLFGPPRLSGRSTGSP